MGAAQLVYVRRPPGVKPPPARSAVYRAQIRQRLIEPARRRRQDWVCWERHRPMELWQLDVLGGIMLADGP